jgi:hypothetical protein
MRAPTGRMINVTVVRNAILVRETWKSFAISEYTRITMK